MVHEWLRIFSLNFHQAVLPLFRLTSPIQIIDHGRRHVGRHGSGIHQAFSIPALENAKAGGRTKYRCPYPRPRGEHQSNRREEGRWRIQDSNE